jgi:hydroxymethylglutaryl-CoA lyase
VPNVRGAQDAIAARIVSVLVVLMASEAFNRKNVRMGVADSLAQSATIKAVTDAAGVRCTGAIGTAFGRPYEGEIPEARVFDLIERFEALGFDELMLADTTGMANPVQIERTMGAVLDRWGDRIAFGLHLHNTRGRGWPTWLPA